MLTMANQGNTSIHWNNDILIDHDEISPQITKSSYYDIDEFNDFSKKVDHDNSISVLNINARSLVKHITELSVILDEFLVSFDVITVEETWLNDVLKPLVNLSGYTFITKHQSQRKEGGGIGIYIKN